MRHKSPGHHPHSRVATTLVLFMVAFSLGLAPANLPAAEDDEWYSHDGWTVEELLQSETGTSLAILRSSAGLYSFLKPGHPSDTPFSLVASGSEQVRLRRGEDTVPILLPILRRNLPVHVLVAALCRLYDKDLIIPVPLSSAPVDYHHADLDFEDRIDGLLTPVGAAALHHAGMVVVAPDDVNIQPYDPTTTATARISFDSLHTTLGVVLGALNAHAPHGIDHDGDPASTLTILAERRSPTEIIHYLNEGLEAGIRFLPPPATDDREEADPSRLSPERVNRLLARSVALARQDRRDDAIRLLLRLAQRTESEPRCYRLLGRLLWERGERRQAVMAMRRALALDPDHRATRAAFMRMRRSLQG